MKFADMKELKLVVGVEQNALTNGIVIPVCIDFKKIPHLMLIGNSGSGKTYTLIHLLKQLAQMDIRLLMADFKGYDFVMFNGCKNYYRHSAVADALKYAYEVLQERMENPESDFKALIFVFDEFSGFISSLEKKEQEKYKQMLASILMLGRGIGVFVILALQRGDSAFISSRDNIGNVLGLSRLSEESLSMSFGEFKDFIKSKEVKGRGKGYLRTDGKPLQEIVVPKIRNYEQALQTIRLALE